jgi:3',5'-cyclic AMP phosphodiesterase CpdA
VINNAGADVVAVSGDLTQRARHRQYRAAREFLDRIGPPVLVVPGNHDVPLDNLWVRLVRPYSRYRHHIAENLEPDITDDQMAIMGINTVNPLYWQRGKVRRRTVRRLCRHFAQGPDHRLNVIVAHHPFEHEPHTDKRLMRHARSAMDSLCDCGAHVLLSGHLHSWRAEPYAHREHNARILQVQVGTGLSSRLRGEPNDFAILTCDGDDLRVERWGAGPEERSFTRLESSLFRRQAEGWLRL